MVFWCFKCKDNDDEDIHHLPRTRNTSINSGQRGRQLDVKAEDVVDGTQKSAEELQQECLDAHNKYRAQHNVPPLVLSKHLNEFATDWANHLANTNTLQHRKNNKYGENLYMATGMLPQIHQLAVKAWYDEIEEYDFNKPGFSPNTGHFTQVIWKSSKEMGMGVATKGSRTWIVCNYDPAGNVLGNFQDCVPPRNEDKVAKVIDKIKTQRKFSTRQKLSKECEEQKSKHLVAGAVAAPSDAVMEIGKTLNIWSKFELECLESHNKYRALHGSPVMRLNKKLCDLALSWSAHLAKNRVMSHRPNNQYGENIYYSMNFEPTAEQAVRSWYNEIENYNFSNPGFSSKTGHFTQVIWKDSVELGVGITIVANMTFVVCNYSPAGNVMGEYQQQVLPLKSKQSSLENSSKATSLAKQSPKSSFEEACLESHNSYRTVHGSPPLTLNKNLNFLAKDWAQHLATKNKIESRNNYRFGENIFFVKDQPIFGANPVDYWYSGIKDFNFHEPHSHHATQQFTQVIWKNSKQLGVGLAKVGHCSYVVCNYDPKGNILADLDDNISPVGGNECIRWHGQHQHPAHVDIFTVNMLKFHNIYRSKHGSPQLKLSHELMLYAQKYVNHVMQHKLFPYAPNYVISIYKVKHVEANAVEIVTDWYQEVERYDYRSPQFNSETRHFTQLVWKSTHFMGVGLSESDSDIMVAVSYEPAGNIDHQYKENVLKPNDS